MATFGQQVLGTDPKDIQVTADGNPVRPAGGITIDWSTVTAVSGSDATYGDGTVVKVGAKGLPYGTVLVRITASQKFGPYDSAASDGRQTLGRGNVVILNTTQLEVPLGFMASATDHPDAIEGGLCWKARIKAGGAGQPTFSALEGVLPLLRYAQ